MKTHFTPEQKKFRAEVREWLNAHVPRERLPSFDTKEGFEQHRAWEGALASGNWSNVNWPTEYGGRGLDLISWLIFEEEYYRVDAPLRVSQNGIFLLAPTIMEYGSEEQKARFLPPMASGQEIWAQAWSEPGAGSDMAAITTKAVREGDYYLINGQKTWSSRAVFADWCFGLFRTDENSKQHKGLSIILVPLNSPGLTRRPIMQLDGESGFAELFFDEVRVPVDNLLGPEHGGWNVAMVTAGFERGLLLRSPARFQAAAARLITLYKQHKDRLSLGIGEQVIQAWMNTERFCAATYQLVSRIQAGASISSEASANKLFWSEMDRHLHRTAMSIMGAQAEIEGGLDAIDNGRWLDGYMFSLAGPIYAGTNEVQRNILAERVLGLPRDRAGK
ncbi:acyl-CoA dehydrogenase family protein [Microbulbifer sp. 2205BS26-8]|uniref:acyl-CoA dehydrogenase family protein n=1 Tax=Microbulbifer sp. 2205BS26-8 TaxID=3064386 RepID=UPI00273DFF2A|nr:acyl-CoA dehydrogenase family protein [Microbulbifer sp. 2205BS26-8]MDP5209269.1 acyl-CoA dehydrogenase family protein [Microbulbifer sp. 2205BS26-8]